METVDGSVTLVGDPLYACIFSTEDGREIIWDITAFRPVVKNTISAGESHDCVINLAYQNLWNCSLVFVPESFSVKEHIFVNMRI